MNKIGKSELRAHFDPKAVCECVGKGTRHYAWQVRLSSGERLVKCITPREAWQYGYGALYYRRQAMQPGWARLYASRGYTPSPEFSEPIAPASVDTHPQDGDGEATAPLVSGAVPERQTPTLSGDSPHAG